MSGPIRSHRGIIDKYIGDGIMAYWGPPFTEDGEQAQLACLAAIDMARRGAALRTELPELLGVRAVPSDCDVRIGIATGEVLVGSQKQAETVYDIWGRKDELAPEQMLLLSRYAEGLAAYRARHWDEARHA